MSDTATTMRNRKSTAKWATAILSEVDGRVDGETDEAHALRVLRMWADSEDPEVSVAACSVMLEHTRRIRKIQAELLASQLRDQK